MQWLSSVFLALAISVDSLGVGFTYGMKKIIVPFGSLIIISVITAFGMLLSMIIGRSVCGLLGNKCSMVGGGILILMGIISSHGALRSKSAKKKDTSKFMPFKIVSKIAQEPMAADLDRSGEITSGEALLLGLVLGTDSLGTGFGAALTCHHLVFTTILVGSLTMLTILVGWNVGQMIKLPNALWADFLPGILLVLLGTIQLI